MKNHLYIYPNGNIIIFQAFEKTKERSNGIQDGTLVLVTEDMHDSVIRFARDNFAPYEPTAVALGLDKESPDWNVLWGETLKLNMSLAIRDNESMKIVGIFAIGIVKVDDQPDYTLYEDTNFKQYVEIIDYWYRKAEVFKHFNVDEYLQEY